MPHSPPAYVASSKALLKHAVGYGGQISSICWGAAGRRDGPPALVPPAGARGDDAGGSARGVRA
jgi:hypothetical protein